MGDKVRPEAMRSLVLYLVGLLFVVWFVSAGIYHVVTS
jgi:hypothetical protein